MKTNAKTLLCGTLAETAAAKYGITIVTIDSPSMDAGNVGLNHGSRCVVSVKGFAVAAKPNGDWLMGSPLVKIDESLLRDSIGRARLVSRFGLRPTEASNAITAFVERAKGEGTGVAPKPATPKVKPVKGAAKPADQPKKVA